MHTIHGPRAGLLILGALILGAAAASAEDTVTGQALDPARYGRSTVEPLTAVLARDRLMPRPLMAGRRGSHGAWVVPSQGAITAPHSGTRHVTNKWGDTRLGIGFPTVVTLRGAYFAGQAAEGAWTTGVQVVGYRAGQQVAATEWFRQIGAAPAWFAMNLEGVDRIEIVAEPVLSGGGWYALDDLTYEQADAPGEPIVLDFEDLEYRTTLTASSYAGLTWEEGTGQVLEESIVPAPQVPPGHVRTAAPAGSAPVSPSRGGITVPTLVQSFQGVIRGDAGSMSAPPDTDGAIGPNHYLETVNRNFAVYDKATGAELVNVLLGSFLPGSNGDPRVLFDHHSGRWVVIVTDFNATATIFLAVSLTDDPTGAWFKTSFETDQGTDAGRWPDYPTLGVDADGIYVAAYMVGGARMTIWAIDKAPLIAMPPSLGTITAFRELMFEGAIQPAHAYGLPAGEYCVSRASSSSLRVRRVNPPLTAPTLTELGTVAVPSFSTPPDVPALGSTTPLDSVGDRLMMSVYRDGSLWTCHTINVGGRAACRWYEIDVATMTLVQSGTVADGTLHYFFPSVMVNQSGDAVLGFSGCHAGQYAAGYYTGRLASDPLGEMAPPVLLHPGLAPHNIIDSYGRNRWGDYSYTTLDPADQSTFWTIQEYAHATDIWGTYVGALDLIPLDCNTNGVPDRLDITGGTSPDCNANWVPDECDLAEGTSPDCQPNGVPDECEITGELATIAFPLDTNPGWTTEGQWAWGQPTGGGGAHGSPDPTAGYTGPNVYGYNLAGDYANALPEYHLTSTAIDCAGLVDVHLSFWRWLGVEAAPYDNAAVRVSNDGTTWVTVWQNTSTVADSAWQYQEFDISAVADEQPTLYLRWTMGTTDGGWTFCGWNVDDLEVRGTRTTGGVNDCNLNGVPDDCDIAAGTSADCNFNAAPDECDVAYGVSQDANGDGIPDECQLVTCRGDCDCDGDVDFDDIKFFVVAISGPTEWYDYHLARLGSPPNCPFATCDANGAGGVTFDDIKPFVALIGQPCSP